MVGSPYHEERGRYQGGGPLCISAFGVLSDVNCLLGFVLQSLLPFPLPVPTASPEQTSSGFPPVASVSLRASGFRVLFSPMTTTQLCTPGKASSLDKSFPTIRDFVSTATHTNGWSILEDSVPGGVATVFIDFTFRLKVAGKCKPISVRRLREDWPDWAGKQWIKRVVHDVLNLFLTMSELAKPLKADRNISDHPSLDCLTKRQNQFVGTTCLLRKRKKEGLPTRARKRARLVSEQLEACCFVLWVDNVKQLRYLRQPSMERHAGWDATAMAVLPGIVLPRQVHGHQFEPTDLPIAALREAKALFRCYTPFTDMILETWKRDYAFRELRAPLDIVRQARGGFQWHPYDLMGSNISSTPGLAQVPEAVALVRTDSLQECVPILADMDVYYSILRLMYWKPTSQIDLRNCLGPFPLLFGIWHCYKHAIELIFRRFRPSSSCTSVRRVSSTKCLTAWLVSPRDDFAPRKP